jgi:RepB DNA-primase from phage plasmid
MNRDATFTPRALTAQEYIQALFQAEEKVAILLRNRGSGRTIQHISSAEKVAAPEYQAWLRAESARGSDVYVGMNPIKDSAYSRTKDGIEKIRHVYLDLDRNGARSLSDIRSSLEAPPPNFVIDTSPRKYQVVWKVAGFNQDEAEQLLRDLSKRFGGDPAATDSTRVLRLPGFPNHKLSAEFVVAVHHENDAVSNPRDFLVQGDTPDTPGPAHGIGARPRAKTTDRKSQSEYDWAYAKRALARGDDPETVIRRIADFRREDKPDPLYYAQHTVRKAQAQMRQEQTNPAASAQPGFSPNTER